MADYFVEAKSRRELRKCAELVRKTFHLEDVVYFPIVQLLDVLGEIFESFSYEIVEDSELPANVHGDTDVTSGHIRIKESVYNRACNGKGRDRMTIAHEICHYITLCVLGFKLQRNFGGEEISTCNDPEWQAKCMAGELMISKRLVGNKSINEIVEACGVSENAASYQKRKFMEEDEK